jgi:A/G-specific adenine glycosylase
MDLGATLCTRRAPRCGECPLRSGCVARAQDRTGEFPASRKPLHRRRREAWMLFAQDAEGAVRLMRRDTAGIWGGLWSPPQFDSLDDALAAAPGEARRGEPLLHVFTHFDLLIHPVWVRSAAGAAVAEDSGTLWYNAARPATIGLPAPVAQLLKNPPP